MPDQPLLTESKPESLATGGLKLKIPPPVYLLLGLGSVYLASKGKTAKPFWRWLGLPFIAVGLGLDLYAVLDFKRNQTTINPLHPEHASQFVNKGAYRYTRNPMYLGMALILGGWSLFRASLSGLLAVPAFMATLTQVQIIPEEQQLKQSFGEPYLAYLKQVRRWL